MLDIETILGISKRSLKRKIHVWFDSEDATKAEALLARRGKLYSLEELKFLHGFMLSGHDACVLDNSEDYSAVELHTAQENERRHSEAEHRLEKAERTENAAKSIRLVQRTAAEWDAVEGGGKQVATFTDTTVDEMVEHLESCGYQREGIEYKQLK